MTHFSFSVFYLTPSTPLSLLPEGTWHSIFHSSDDQGNDDMVFMCYHHSCDVLAQGIDTFSKFLVFAF